MEPKQLRELIRTGERPLPTAGLAPGYTQANLAILPKEDAFDFLLFCQRNPKSCPLIDVLEPGEVESRFAKGSDIRTDVPLYRIYKDGKYVEEVADIRDLWQDDFVSFLIGCSFTFEEPLLEANIPIRHIEENCNVPMYQTSIQTTPAGRFSGPMVVSMRPMTPLEGIQAAQITSRLPAVHGAPVHIGDPSAIGIQDVSAPDFGDAVTIKDGEVPVFWACGVTPQAVAMNSKPRIMITHAPGHMFITDLKNATLSL